MDFKVGQRVCHNDKWSGTIIKLNENVAKVAFDDGDYFDIQLAVLEPLPEKTQTEETKKLNSSESEVFKPYIMSVLHPKQSGARNYYIEQIIVLAPDAETALKKAALDCGRMHRSDHKISEPVEMEIDETIRFGGGFYAKSEGENFKGRLVSSLLCEIALEKE